MTLSNTELRNTYTFSLTVADACRSKILELWRSNVFDESLKSDHTPVTSVDLKTEELARTMISASFPDHGIIGEEFDSTNRTSDYQWTIDPIDGTQNLVNRIPTFGTLIGLRFKGEAVLGVIDHPVMDLRTNGGLGLGVFHNGSKVVMNDLSGDHLSPNDLVVANSIAVCGDTAEGRNLFSDVISFHPQHRIYYDCYAHTLAILGRVAVVVEPNLKIWDITPFEAMITELNGCCVKFGPTDPVAGSGKINSVFGKPKAVRLMCEHLKIVSVH